jgi:hypothetical protein
MKIRHFGIALALPLMGIITTQLALPVFAQNAPANTSPGAVMRYEQQGMFYRQVQPYLFRPITVQDTTGQDVSGEPALIIQDGVIPPAQQPSIHGIIQTPEGKTTIQP